MQGDFSMSSPSIIGFFEHPIDYVSALFSDFSSVPGDTRAEGDIRAIGIDPDTATVISPVYDYSLKLRGIDPNDPNSIAKAIAAITASSDAFYNKNLKTFASGHAGDSLLTGTPNGLADLLPFGGLGATDTFSALIVLALIGLAIYLLFKVV